MIATPKNVWLLLSLHIPHKAKVDNFHVEIASMTIEEIFPTKAHLNHFLRHHNGTQKSQT